MASKLFSQKNRRIRIRIKVLTILCYITALISITIFMNSPSKPKTINAEQKEFSAERAMKHVENIAQAPHPTGSEEIKRVRKYIIEELSKLGLNPITQVHNGYLNVNEFSDNIELHNIIGVLKGTENGKALMVSAHYDSVPTGPGANDNTSSVAAILEVISTIKNGESLKNDVWFVFTDGEELGLLGAEVFWANKEYREKIGLVVNLEARGSKGPSMMYQTSNGNGKLIREFVKATPNPVANSFMGDIYRTLPNNTDLTVSLKAGIPGLNFAYIDGWETYHMPFDNLESVNKSSLQHQGENALAMVGSFGNVNLSNLQSPNEVYFNFFGWMIHYPESLVIPLTLLLSVLVTVLFFSLKKKGLVQFKGISFCFLSFGLCSVISVLFSFALYKGIYVLWAENMTSFTGATYDSILYKLSFIVITIIINAILSLRFRNKTSQFEMIFTGMFLFLCALHATTWFLPGASYVFSLPLIIYCILVRFSLTKPDPIKVISSTLVIMISIFLPITLFTTVFQLLFMGLPALTTIGGVIIIAILLAIIDPINRLLTNKPKTFISVGLIIVMLLISIGGLKANLNVDRPVYQDRQSVIKK
ncbi:M20/M25/M40 family metallo-hydrolase [Bacillus cereus]|uniref:M20/M25/M40 family metallo-hydrolase n=1 Tax=Bacillus cereus TaxID=1396 RepID=UPI001374B2C6|nr:M20/M25/M40 family metallo-hydrolase [Bacillus cereus]